MGLVHSALIAGLALASAPLARAAPLAQPDPALYGDLHWRELGPFRGGWATMVEGVALQPDTFFFAGAGGGKSKRPL